MICDFHVHSDVSDGTLTPVEVVEAASREGIDVLALTDHDGVDGVIPARERGRQLGVEVLSGVEISVSEDDGRRQLHMLGLGVDPKCATLLERLARVRSARRERAAAIAALLASHDVRIDPEALRPDAPQCAVGRLHIARALVAAGACRDVDNAFTRWLRRGRPAFVPSPGLGAREAIDRWEASPRDT